MAYTVHERNLISEDTIADIPAFDHLASMAEQAEAGDVRAGFGADLHRDLGAEPVQPRHPGDRGRQVAWVGPIDLGRGGNDAGAEGFRQHQAVARACAAFRLGVPDSDNLFALD